MVELQEQYMYLISSRTFSNARVSLFYKYWYYTFFN